METEKRKGEGERAKKGGQDELGGEGAELEG